MDTEKLKALLAEREKLKEQELEAQEALDANYHEITGITGQCPLCGNWHYPHCGNISNVR